ncbi:MAG: diguanylate cyclase [Comamonas sp.]
MPPDETPLDPGVARSTAAAAPAPVRVHWMVRMNWRNRSLFSAVLVPVFAVHLREVHADTATWVLMLVQLLLFPQLVYGYASRQRDSVRQRRAELGVMHLEALLFALWSALLGFPLWPSFILFAAMCLNFVVFMGWHGLWRLVLVLAAGVLLGAALVHPLRWQPDTSLLVTGMCMAVFTAFLVSFARDGYLRALGLHQSRSQARRQLEEISLLQARLREAALRDPLTGLYNRRHLSDTLPGALARCARQGTPLTLVMIDIDHFKQINDRHGHAAGDAMLQALAQLLQTQVREGDMACRMGGEEFLLVLENAALRPAWERAQALCQAFEALAVVHDGARLQATVSCGLASCPEDGTDADTLLRSADRALYAAKAGGRNQLRAASAVA